MRLFNFNCVASDLGMLQTMKLLLLLGALSGTAAHPTNFNCDLSSSFGGSANSAPGSLVAVTPPSVMGAPMDDTTSLGSFGILTYLGGSVLTFSVATTNIGVGLIHTSAGTITPGTNATGFTNTGGTCVGSATSVYTANNFGSDFTITLPADVTSLATVEVWVIGKSDNSYGELRRSKYTLTRDAAYTAAPTPATGVPTSAPTKAPTVSSAGFTSGWSASAASIITQLATAANPTSTPQVHSVTTMASGIEANGTPGFTVTWVLDEAQQTVTFALEAQTTGWVAIGLAEAAGMKGADMMMGHVDSTTGEVKIGDYHAVANQQPILDGCQDWSVLWGEESAATKSTLLVVRRNLTTADSNDRAILLNSIKRLKIITAMGAYADDGPSYGYHGAFKTKTDVDLRNGVAVTIASWTAAKEATLSWIDFRVDEAGGWTSAAAPQSGVPTGTGYPIPAVTTTYVNFCFTATDITNQSPSAGQTAMVAYSSLPDPTGRSNGVRLSVARRLAAVCRASHAAI